MGALRGSLYRTIPEVMVADVVEPGKRIEAYGLLRIGSNMTFIYLLIAIFFLRDTRPKAVPGKLKLKDLAVVAADKPFLMFCGLMLFMTIPYQQMYTLFSVYSSAYVGLDKFWIGVLFALSGSMVALFQYNISTKVSRHRMTAALAFSAVVFALGFGMLSLSTAFFMPFMAMAVITFAEMIWAPASSTLQANMSPENMRGRYFGFNGLTGSIGWAIGPLFGGVLKDAMNDSVPSMWTVVGAMFFVCTIGFLGLGHIISKKADCAKGYEKLEQMELRV